MALKNFIGPQKMLKGDKYGPLKIIDLWTTPVQPLYSTPHYNMEFDITWPYDGS